MKRFGITFLMTLVLGIFTIQAGINEGVNNKREVLSNLDTSTEYESIKVAAKVPKGLKNAIINELVYPKQAQVKNLEGQVYMRLTVDQNSMVKIVEMNSTTPMLGAYVKKQLTNIKVKNPGCQPGQVYMMKVNFDLLN